MEDFNNEVLPVPPPVPPPPIAANGIMNDNDDAINAANDGNEFFHFHYTGGGREVVPKNVTHITVDPSVARVDSTTFRNFLRLTTVELPEGLERIESSAFRSCEMLSRINIPSSVKVIEQNAFFKCFRLEGVELPEGLEKLGYRAFFRCTSLQSIRIPPRIKSIRGMAFKDCDALRYVYLSEGLKSIGQEAFAYCPLLKHMTIPSTVKRIHPDAFLHYVSMKPLMKIQFCDEINDLVLRESLRYWYGDETLKRSLKTFNFLVRCNIPARLEQLLIASQTNIHGMIRDIPSVTFVALDDYFNTINSELAFYKLHDAITVLELAIWKSKISEQYGRDMDNVSAMAKLQCRVECGACVIIPNVLSFL
jgi:hypothetical protein